MESTRRRVDAELQLLREGGTLRQERQIASPQSARVCLSDGRSVLNLCANNYLGLADHPEVIAAAHEALDRWGYGAASVRFICGSQTIHHELESAVSEFLGTEDTILYSSCFDANGGLFETLLGPEDAVISDELNHASIIDGVRLCRAKRLRYRHRDTDHLRAKLQEADAANARTKLVTTDGVFSMDGTIANLAEVCDIAEEFDALVHFDDCHATGFWGPTGRGTHEYAGVVDRIALTTGTFGKALGGASGGYTSGRKELIALLRQRSRPYLFSNSLPPPVAAGALKSVEIASTDSARRDRLMSNTRLFRRELNTLGVPIIEGDHPIVPVMVGDSGHAVALADQLLENDIYVIGFCYPVVPKGEARVRVQLSSSHTEDDLIYAANQFADCLATLADGGTHCNEAS